LGLKSRETKIRVKIISSIGATETLTQDNVIEIDSRIVLDTDMSRMAYTDYELLWDKDVNQSQILFQSIASGVNYYLVASYAGRPQLASLTARVRQLDKPCLHDIDNKLSFSGNIKNKIEGAEMGWSTVGDPITRRAVVDRSGCHGSLESLVVARLGRGGVSQICQRNSSGRKSARGASRLCFNIGSAS
jgi:hypothetical protein